jgi:hypothetical protein
VVLNPFLSICGSQKVLGLGFQFPIVTGPSQKFVGETNIATAEKKEGGAPFRIDWREGAVFSSRSLCFHSSPLTLGLPTSRFICGGSPGFRSLERKNSGGGRCPPQISLWKRPARKPWNRRKGASPSATFPPEVIDPEGPERERINLETDTISVRCTVFQAMLPHRCL